MPEESYLHCSYRQRVPLDKRLLANRQALIEVLQVKALAEEAALLQKLPESTDPCCVHKDAPWVAFGGIRDPFLCEITILENRCPLGHKPAEVDPNWRENRAAERRKACGPP